MPKPNKFQKKVYSLRETADYTKITVNTLCLHLDAMESGKNAPTQEELTNVEQRALRVVYRLARKIETECKLAVKKHLEQAKKPIHGESLESAKLALAEKFKPGTKEVQESKT